MSPRLIPLTALAAALLSGCAMGDANYALSEKGADGVPDEYLRVDVHPSDRNADLLPESHWVDGWWYEGDTLALSMSTPVRIDGTVTSQRTAGGPVDDDGRATPVGAAVSAWIDGSIMAATTTSDDITGAYQLSLPPQAGWAVAVVPEDGSNLPFAVYTDQDIAHDRSDWNLELDNGAVVRGVVTDRDGEPMSAVAVRAVHSATGVAGPAVHTRANGAYTLHLEPDAYTLEFGDGAIPTTSIELEAELDAVQFADLQLGSLDTAAASGRVVDARTNRPAAGVALRFWSRGLADHPSAAMEIEATTDQAGAYSVDLLPGQWKVDLVAEADQQLTPSTDSFYVGMGEDVLDLGVTELEPYATVQAVVRGPSGDPASGVTVVVSEQAIAGRTFTTTTDLAGSFELSLPATELHVVLTPGDSSAAVTHLDLAGDDFPAALDLSLGRLLTGRVVHDHQPVQAALVEVRDGSTEQLYATTITDLDGWFEIRLATDADDLAPNEGTDQDTGYWDTGYVE